MVMWNNTGGVCGVELVDLELAWKQWDNLFGSSELERGSKKETG
jgi:hypothetical protein